MELFDILKDRLQNIASINHQIKKSVSADFNYSVRQESKGQENGSLFVSKTGKEIKEAVDKDKSLCESSIETLASKMEDMAKEIGQDPLGSYKDSDEWFVKDWIGKIDMPKKYQYDQLYSTVSNQPYQNSPDKAEPTNKKMFEFNELARKFICLQIEKRKLQTIINALQDNKTYKLTIDIASKLGF
jgi:gas vesicle protein